MSSFFDAYKYIVLTGNYGSGKTEIALNLALQYARKMKVTLVDLDIVNPYFRSGEKAQDLKAAGVRMLMPTFALTTVDIPALPAEIQSVFEEPSDLVIFDVGGDDTGAAALGRYYPSFMARREQTVVAMVVNCMRPLTENKEDIIDLAERIAIRGRLKIDALINNTNLADRTTQDMLEKGGRIVNEVSGALGINNVLTAGQADLLKHLDHEKETIEIQRMMVPEWMQE